MTSMILLLAGALFLSVVASAEDTAPAPPAHVIPLPGGATLLVWPVDEGDVITIGPLSYEIGGTTYYPPTLTCDASGCR